MSLAYCVSCVCFPQEIVRRGSKFDVIVHLLCGVEDLPMQVPFVPRAQGIGSDFNVS